MIAQEKLLEYASKKNDTNNNVSTWKLTNEEFIGKMVTEGVVIERTPNSRTVARARREGKTIILTETVVLDTAEVVDGKMVFGKSETTAEVLRIEL